MQNGLLGVEMITTWIGYLVRSVSKDFIQQLFLFISFYYDTIDRVAVIEN